MSAGYRLLRAGASRCHLCAEHLALEPEDRTRTAVELRRALEAVSAAHPERGTPSTRIDGRNELIGLAGTGGRTRISQCTVAPATSS